MSVRSHAPRRAGECRPCRTRPRLAVRDCSRRGPDHRPQAQDRAVQLLHRQQVAPDDGEPVQGGAADGALQVRGRGHLVQLGQRRQQAVAADLQPDLAGRRRDPDRRRLADRPERHPQAGVQRGILVVSFDNTVTEPSGITISMDEFGFGVHVGGILAKKIERQGQRHHGHRRRRHLRRRGAQQGRRQRLGEISRHQGGGPLHRHVGLGRLADQHRRDPADLAEGRRHLVPERHRRRAEGLRRGEAARRCRRLPAPARTASASS